MCCNAQVVTLDELEPLNASLLTSLSEKETKGSGGDDLRILVTVHTLKPCFGSLYVKGLGMWVAYIIQKYLKRRGKRIARNTCCPPRRKRSNPLACLCFGKIAIDRHVT